MPLNQIKTYNSLLDISGLSERDRKTSLKAIFNRDVSSNINFKFKGKQIQPTPKEGELKLETLYAHLTTVVTDKKTRKREYDIHRSKRLHWLKYHVEEKRKEGMLVFSSRDKDGIRTYIYDVTEYYVIVLEPLRKIDEYYLLSAYHLRGRDKEKIANKYKRRRLNELY
jgi:hypothetical protein